MNFRFKKPKSRGNKYPSKSKGGYVSPNKGYVRTPTINPADVAYQKMYEQYLQKEDKNWEKIYNTLKNSKQKQELAIHIPPEYKNPANPGSIDGPEGKESDFIIKLYEEAKKDIKNGKVKISNGDKTGGTRDVVKGIGKLYFVVFYSINDIIPKSILYK